MEDGSAGSGGCDGQSPVARPDQTGKEESSKKIRPKQKAPITTAHFAIRLQKEDEAPPGYNIKKLAPSLDERIRFFLLRIRYSFTF